MTDKNDGLRSATSLPSLEELEEKRRRAGDALRGTKEWQDYMALNQAARLLGLEPDIHEHATASAAMDWHELKLAVQANTAPQSRSNLVAAILTAANAPMTTAEILKSLENLGHRISRDKGGNILAATLTRDSRFANIVGPGRKRRWKLADDPS